MRVAIMPSAFWPAVGGVEELTRRLADALVERGDSVEIWAPMDSRRRLPHDESCEGLRVRRFAMPLPPAVPTELLHALATAPAAMRDLRRAVREFRPDILHVQCFGPNGAYAAALSFLTRAPLVLTLQGETVMDDHDIYERSVSLRAALRLGFCQATAVTACSAFTLADAQRFGLKPGKGKVIFNGVRLDEAGSMHWRGSDDAPPEPVPFERYVLAMGRVVEKKGFDLLLDAFARVPYSQGIGLVIGGDGNALGSLRTRAVNLGIADRVYLPGRLGRSSVASLMRGADVFVMPSRIEPFGIVVLEAWREGTAVIATRHGGPPEFIEDGADGLLVDPFDASELAGKIGILLSDASLRSSIARKGQAKVRAFSWPAIAQQYRELYLAATRAGGA